MTQPETLNDHFERSLSARAAQVPVSALESVADYGRDHEGVIPLWAGEGNVSTPAFICSPTQQSLDQGETFYTWQSGIPALQEALARYYSRHFGRPFLAGEFIVTMGGMHAICLALQATSIAGDQAIYLSPAWPNFAAAARLAGVEPISVPLSLDAEGWSFDIEQFEAAITPKTKSIFINSPSNPTGWVADRETLVSILAIARKYGLWIIADEIYSRFYFSGDRAASFLDVEDEHDRILYVNSFSKNWAMTGWRIGWMRVPQVLRRRFSSMIQYSTSGVPTFLQRGAVAALDEGDTFVDQQVKRARLARDLICQRLLSTNRVSFAPPEGAFYLFFKIDNVRDSYTAATDLIDQVGVGLAPGIGFGAEGEGFLRLCFHRDLSQLEDATDRLINWIGRS